MFTSQTGRGQATVKYCQIEWLVRMDSCDWDVISLPSRCALRPFQSCVQNVVPGQRGMTTPDSVAAHDACLPYSFILQWFGPESLEDDGVSSCLAVTLWGTNSLIQSVFSLQVHLVAALFKRSGLVSSKKVLCSFPGQFLLMCQSHHPGLPDQVPIMDQTANGYCTHQPLYWLHFAH